MDKEKKREGGERVTEGGREMRRRERGRRQTERGGNNQSAHNFTFLFQEKYN